MATTTTISPEKQQLKDQSNLVRIVAASLDIRIPSKKEIAFRGVLLRKSISELPKIQTAFLVRLYEAACKVEYSDADLDDFRVACQAPLAAHLSLAEFKARPSATTTKP